MSTIVELRGICKRYPGVVALDGVDVDIQEGSCHALMGENGAGKSTLGKILAGVTRPDEGTVVLNGRSVSFGSPAEALKAGIGMVHQELMFCENLSVAENLCLGDTPHRGPFVSSAAVMERAESELARVGAAIDPRIPLGLLSIGKQQTVQIASAVARGARVMIFDEPTSSLSHSESEKLFELIEQLRSDGVTCIYVSHRLPEVFRLCDTVTILRDGKLVVTKPLAEFTPDTLVTSMIGRELGEAPPPSEADAGPVMLRVEGLSSPGKFEDVSFELRSGEVLGFAGLVGAGRTEVSEAIFGLDSHATGSLTVDDVSVPLGSIRRMIRLGIGLVPEDRKRHGLVLPMKIRENTTLPALGRFSIAGWVQSVQEKIAAKKFFDRLRVRAPSLETPTSGLSGGNQQKVVIAKWLTAECRILMVDEPTRGVDVGAKREIHDLLREMAAEGKAVLAISSELPELLAVSSRIIVFRNGKIVGEQTREQATEESLIRLMTGV